MAYDQNSTADLTSSFEVYLADGSLFKSSGGSLTADVKDGCLILYSSPGNVFCIFSPPQWKSVNHPPVV